MAITYAVDFKGCFLNEFFHKQIDKDKILVTTRHGGWVILNEEEFRLLRQGRVEGDINLYNLLRQEGVLIAEDDINKITNFYKSRYAHLFEGTTLHIVTPTLRCNHKCIYCYASSKPLKERKYDMDRKTAKAVVDFIFQCPAKGISIEFQGGEPLLNFSIVQFIVDYGKKLSKKKKKNVNFRLVTNLTLMDEEKLKYFIKNNVYLNSSLDGPKEVHDKNRKYENGKGSYDDVVHWIKILKERKVPISCLPTITRFSLPYWKEIIDEYVKLGLPRFWARRLNISGFALGMWNELGYTPEEFLNFWKRCVDYIFELNKKGVSIEEGNIELILRNILFSKKYNSFVCMASPCGCAWGQLSYNYAGDVYTCDEARSFDVFKLGSVKNSTYAKMLSSKRVMDIIGLTSGLAFDCSACVYHPFCGSCIVDSYGEYGNIIQKPNTYNCKIKRGMLEYIFKEIILDREKIEIAQKWLGVEKK